MVRRKRVQGMKKLLEILKEIIVFCGRVYIKHFEKLLLALFGGIFWIGIKTWNLEALTYEDVIDALKTSVTVMISMIGFSVSIYVFLNTTLQSRQNKNIIEKEIILLFKNNKKKELGKVLICSIFIVFAESILISLKHDIEKWSSMINKDYEKYIGLAIIFSCVIVTLLNIIILSEFTYRIINYEDGLKRLAIIERGKHDDQSRNIKISKGEFLNLVNNIEVLVERLIENHMHAKTSNASDSNFKRAICDGFTNPGDINTRENLAEHYGRIINYRNLLLQDKNLKDSNEVGMGDEIKSVMNQLFQFYLKNELLTGVNISNLNIIKADLSKTSFCNSSFRNIFFEGKTVLYGTDFKSSTLNNVIFEEANCENVNFAGSKLIDVIFDAEINLQCAIFTNADLSNIKVLGTKNKDGNPIKLSFANFNDANLTNLDIYNVCFDYTNMRNTRFVHSNIGKLTQKANNTTFKYANMMKANLLQCTIERCNFQNATLDKSVFTHAQIQDVNFRECRLEDADFTESTLCNSKFDKSYCKNISLKEANIAFTTFTYTTLNLADLSGAKMNNVRFNDAVCRDSLWVRTEIKDSEFERCVFTGARIVGESSNMTEIRTCNFAFVNFTDAAISNIEFKECDFYGADFTDSRLINIRFIDCKNLGSVLANNVWQTNVSYYGNYKEELPMPRGGWRYKK